MCVFSFQGLYSWFRVPPTGTVMSVKGLRGSSNVTNDRKYWGKMIEGNYESIRNVSNDYLGYRILSGLGNDECTLNLVIGT